MHQLQREDSTECTDPVTGVKIGYIGGGSQGWAHTLINDLAQCPDISGEVALYDINYEPATKNAQLGEQVIARDDAVGDWEFEAYRELDEALTDSDFVICSIQDPPAETFKHDLDIPKEYGVYQTVGDTVGPGGTFRAMRAIPQYREIARTIREGCPDAWVINYTNPMTVCTRALYEEYPEINAIGLCHEVFGAQEKFASLAEKYIEGAEDVSRDEIDINVKGINHFTWVDKAYWKGHDVFQYLDEKIEEIGPLPRFEPGDLDGQSYWTNKGDICFDLYDRFGMLGAAGDRHLVEFVPWYLDIDAPGEIQRWGTRCTPSSARVADDQDASAATRTERYLAGDEDFRFRESGEEAIPIMRALLGGQPIKTHLNHPNTGQIPDLPRGAVVETNAHVTGDSVRPITAGTLTRPVRNLVLTHVHNQETLIEAGFAGDLDLAYQAFMNEPLVSIGPDEATEMFRDLVDAERPYLGSYNFEEVEILGD